MSSPPSWLTSLTCSPSPLQSPPSPAQFLLHWSTFIFLSPCSQRILFSFIDLIFLLLLLLLLLLFSLHKFPSKLTTSNNANSTIPLLQEEDLHHHHHHHRKVTFFYHFTFFLISLLAISYTVLSILTLAHTTQTSSSWKLIETLFLVSQAITNIVVMLVMVKEKKVKDTKHFLPLRIYWFINFVLVSIFVASAIYRLATIGDEANFEINLRIDDIFSIVNLPIAVFLSIMAVKGSSGIHVAPSSQNLLRERMNLSPYTFASLFSKTVWFWMNPLLHKGYYNSPLELDDVPSLPPEFRAEKMSELFETNWPKPEENSKYTVGITLLRCFWKHLACTGILAVIRLAVTFVGPLLIEEFVAYTTRKQSPTSQGLVLILILLLAKSIEVLSAHQFNFHSQKLGMLIRSSLITSLYKKGLKLSNSSRQAHGVGQIVNYMAVDTQQISDMVLQLHSVWLMPLQIISVLVLIYCFLGLSTLAALFGTIALFAYVLLSTRKISAFQYSIMANRDLRMKALSDMLRNMRVIKFQAWEEQFGSKIRRFRELEYDWIGKLMYSSGNSIGILWISPTMIAILTFGAAILLGFALDAGVVFTVTSVIKILQEPVRSFPQALISVSQAMISLGRMDEFMRSRELDERSVERDGKCDDNVIAVEIKEGSFSWDDEGGRESLEVSEMEIKRGDFAAVIGTVGSGKSSLLASVLGEMHKISGKVRVSGTAAYVAQTSWIQNVTIQENILFGLPMKSEKYKEVIRVCCLEKDFGMLEYGDQTEIGERGINLSGGQKQRIQLARAVYQDSDIYLLDDIFSAVDSQTGSFIFKECVMGALRYKTIILVTHQIDFLHNANLILVMRDGKIVQSGNYNKLVESGLDFGSLVAAHETSLELLDSSDDYGQSSKQEESIGKINPQEEPKSSHSSNSFNKVASNIIEDEEKETGRVNFEVYKQYCTEAYGWWGGAVIVFMSLLWIVSIMLGDYWLAFETSKDGVFNPILFIGVYFAIGVVSCVMVMMRSYVVTHWGLKTAQSFFCGMLEGILHAPMSFFDTTPSGRVLSRMSTDQLFIDILIPMLMGLVLVTYFSVLSIFFITCQNAWEMIFLLIPLIWLNNWYRKYYVASSRELSRLDSITKAPVIDQFSETISGVMTIRGFRKQSIFCEENIKRVNANLRMEFHNNGSYEWLGFRLDLLGVIFLCFATMFMIFLPSPIIRPEYVGLSLSYGLTLSAVMSFSITLTCQVENKMVSVERIKQFTNIPSEAPWTIPNGLPPHNWPTHGHVKLHNLQVRYRPNTPLVLKGISLSIHGGEKVGIVGRTGSGKSTLIQVLFRLVEPSGGKIAIDGIDICTLGLHDLRSRFGIIPQDPLLFQGTSLERCQLKDVVAAKNEKLDASVVDGGENWSVGQRQLLCLGRIMLKRSQIVFMDEATASVDSQTDTVNQEIMREDFSTTTVLSIAHRIPTVMDSDKVLVMDEGLAKEFDKPARLLERPSLFGALVHEYARRSS
ncbi:ABC transporter C family member 14-like [Senna tora]|uniref:ABC-type xenobiotic transporter n=1 Tax=Senna tora TaxID=362788 RepID=A0A834WY49_9FABA|nr:ABC transporter C family member 14-like [Senna tora]